MPGSLRPEGCRHLKLSGWDPRHDGIRENSDRLIPSLTALTPPLPLTAYRRKRKAFSLACLISLTLRPHSPTASTFCSRKTEPRVIPRLGSSPNATTCLSPPLPASFLKTHTQHGHQGNLLTSGKPHLTAPSYFCQLLPSWLPHSAGSKPLSPRSSKTTESYAYLCSRLRVIQGRDPVCSRRFSFLVAAFWRSTQVGE